jgi:hypothetical protein
MKVAGFQRPVIMATTEVTPSGASPALLRAPERVAAETGAVSLAGPSECVQTVRRPSIIALIYRLVRLTRAVFPDVFLSRPGGDIIQVTMDANARTGNGRVVVPRLCPLHGCHASLRVAW